LNIRRLAAALGVIIAVALGVAAPAWAHITIDPKQAPAGSDAELTFSAPNEMDSANTTQLQVFFPTDHPIASASVKAVPGWTFSVQTMQVTTPISTDSGNGTQAVRSVTWTGGSVKPGEFQQFTISVGLPAGATSLEFKAIQTYDNGQVVRWIDATPKSGPSPDHPAPVLTLTKAPAQDTSATTSAANAATASPSDSTARTLGIIGIVVGAIGVIIAAVTFTMRRTTA
jgi:uncharacterized protein YcnI